MHPDVRRRVRAGRGLHRTFTRRTGVRVYDRLRTRHGGHLRLATLHRRPDFEQGCAHWHLIRQIANATDVVVADIAASELKLSVDHRCSSARATAEVYLPSTQSMPNAAVAITASGSAGALLAVNFQNGMPVLIGPPRGEMLSGTGDWERYVVCLPGSDRGQGTSLTLGVESGTCAEPLDAAFAVRSLEMVSDTKCKRVMSSATLID